MPTPEPNLESVPIFHSSDLQVGHEEIFNALKLLESKKSTDFNDISMFLSRNVLMK